MKSGVLRCQCGHMPSAVRLRRRGRNALCHGLRCRACKRFEWAITPDACIANWNAETRAERDDYDACAFDRDYDELTSALAELVGAIEAVSSAANDVEIVHDDDCDPSQELETLLDVTLDLVAYINELVERCANTDYGNGDECATCGGSGGGRGENRCMACGGKGEV